MNKFLFLLFWTVFPGYVFAQRSVVTLVTDTITFVRPADTTVYTAGDIIADSGAINKYFVFSKLNYGNRTSTGKIVYVTVLMDTANSTNTSLKVRFFGVSDTTGLYAAFPSDNNAFQSKYQLGTGAYYFIGDAPITLTVFGTTAGGATSAEGNYVASMPYFLPNGKIYAALIATGAFTPKINGRFKVIVVSEIQY